MPLHLHHTPPDHRFPRERVLRRLRHACKPQVLPALVARRLSRSALVHALFLPLLALGQEPATREADPMRMAGWGIGVAASTAASPYRGADRDNRALPLLYFDNRWVRVLGPSLELKLLRLDLAPSSTLDLGGVVKYEQNGYDADDAPILSGMAERKDGIWAGARITWRNPIVDVTAEAVTDASSYSKGHQFTLGAAKTFRAAPRLQITPRVLATWLSEDYVGYYYGVRSNEVRPGRAAYRGDAAIKAELGLRATYLFDRSHSVFVDASVTRLADEIKQSPLVDRSSVNRVSIGYLYRF